MKINGYCLGLAIICTLEYPYYAYISDSIKYYPSNMFICGVLMILFYGLAFRKRDKICSNNSSQKKDVVGATPTSEDSTIRRKENLK